MNLLDRITTAIFEIQHGWTSPEKGCVMAAMVLALRPALSLEIGVYAGKGLVALGMAHAEIGTGSVIGIDPYSPIASAEGQVNETDRKFWGSLNHNAVYQLALSNLQKYGLLNICKIERIRSDQYEPPENIGVLRIDGNHGEQAEKDFERYTPKVAVGGFLLADDVGWSGGAISRAVEKLEAGGKFKRLYRLDDGLVYQRVK